jgi:hypothetical protein
MNLLYLTGDGKASVRYEGASGGYVVLSRRADGGWDEVGSRDWKQDAVALAEQVARSVQVGRAEPADQMAQKPDLPPHARSRPSALAG